MPSLAALLLLCLGTSPVRAVLPDALRLSPKNAQAGEAAGAVAAGFGRVALGSPAAVNPGTNVATGAVYLFDARTGRELATIFPPAAEANAGMEFGFAVAISGNLLVVGAPGTDNRGAGFVYDLRTGKLLGGKLQSVFFQVNDRMGEAVAIDGDRVALASPVATGFAENAAVAAGLVYVRELGSGVETLVSPDSANLPGATPGAAGDGFGTALALRGDLLVVGAPGAQVGADAGAGRVYVASLNAGGVAVLVTEVENPHVADGAEDGTGDGFGSALALGGRHLVVGAPENEGQRGVAHVFDASRPGEMTYWNVVNGVGIGDRLGEAVATAGNLVLMSSGGRFVFGYLLQGPFQGSLAWSTLEVAADGYGRQLALADDLLVVAAPGWDGVAGSDTGSAVLHSAQQLACPDFFPLAITRNAAHGTSGDVYADFPEVVCHLGGTALESGTPLFTGRLQKPLVTGATGGVWAYDAAQAAVPLLGTTNPLARTISRPVGNMTGQWWWRGQQSGPSLPNFFSTDGLGVTAELHNGSGLLWGVNRPIKAADELRVDDTVADRALVTLRLKTGGDVNKDNDSGIYDFSGAPAGQSFLVREGDPAGPANVAVGELAPRVSLNTGVVSFACALQGPGTSAQTNQAVFYNGALVARRGDTAPEVLAANGAPVAASFGSFTGITHGPSPGCLFRATLNPAVGVASANNEGLWSDRTGTLGMVLQKGLPAPLLGGVIRVKRLLDFALLGGGDVLVLAQVSGPGVKAANDLLLYLVRPDVAEPGNFEILAREGDRLPALNGARLGTILRLETATVEAPSARTHYGLLCSLVNEPGRVTAASNQVWLAGDTVPGALDQPAVRRALPKLRKGAASHFYGPGFERLTGIALPAVTRDASGARHTGMAHVIDPRSGGSTGVVSFPNKRKAAGLILR